MKINDVLECFNEALDSIGNPNKIHYVAHSTIEKKIGTVKSASTIITLIDPQAEPKEVVRAQHTASVSVGQEGALLEEACRKALTDFIIKWTDDTGVR